MNTLQLTVEPDRTGGLIDPADGAVRQIHVTHRALEVSQLVALIEGDTAQSVNFTVKFGTDIRAAGTEIVTGGMTTTNNIGGETFAVLDEPSIPAGSVIWIAVTTVVAVVREFSVTLSFA